MAKPRGGARPGSGQPPKEFDWDLVDEAAASLNNKTKIAHDMKCHVDTVDAGIKRHYGIDSSVYFEQKKQVAWSRILSKQFEIAMAGNVTMLIWLGKNFLNQTDRSQIEQNVNGSLATLDLSKLSIDKLKLMNALLKEASQKD